MVTIRTSDSTPLHIDMELTPPNVYLDYCVVADFSADKNLGDQFRSILLTKGGTICISALHLVEISNICPGKTYSAIKEYLESFERNFALLDYDPNTVIQRERSPEPLKRKAPLDAELTKELVLKWGGLSLISLGILLDVLEHEPKLQKALRELHATHKSSMHAGFLDFRKIYRFDAKAKERIDKTPCPPPRDGSPIEYIYCQLRRVCVREDLTPNDTIDFFHSTVSASYMQYAVLDKKWAARLRRIPAVPEMSQVFAANEYPAFLKALAA